MLRKYKHLFVRLYVTKENNGKYFHNKTLEWSEAVAQRSSVKKVFSKISQNPQENIY